MNAIDSVLTYIPFVYFLLVSCGMAMMNHVWYPKYRPYTDMVVLMINTWVFVFNKLNRKLLVKNILLYHIWNAITFSTYAFTINSIHDAMFREFAVTDTSLKMTLGVIYMALVFFFSYVRYSLNYMFGVHMVFMFINVERNWIINLAVFDLSLVLYIINMFSNVENYQIDDTRTNKKPLFMTYQYLTLHQYVIWIVLLHGFIEYYFKDVISQNHIESDLFDMADDVYKNTKTKMKKVRFANTLVTEEEVESFINVEEGDKKPKPS